MLFSFIIAGRDKYTDLIVASLAKRFLYHRKFGGISYDIRKQGAVKTPCYYSRYSDHLQLQRSFLLSLDLLGKHGNDLVQIAYDTIVSYFKYGC